MDEYTKVFWPRYDFDIIIHSSTGYADVLYVLNRLKLKWNSGNDIFSLDYGHIVDRDLAEYGYSVVRVSDSRNTGERHSSIGVGLSTMDERRVSLTDHAFLEISNFYRAPYRPYHDMFHGSLSETREEEFPKEELNIELLFG